MARDIDCEYTRQPVCPHCGDVFDLGKHDRELDISYEDGGHTDCKCGGCGKEFVAVTIVCFKYSTAVDQDHADDDLWGPQQQPETV